MFVIMRNKNSNSNQDSLNSMAQSETTYKYEYPIHDMKTLKTAVNSSFDSFLKNLPLNVQNNLPFKNKLKNCKDSIIGILKGQGNILWEKLEKEVTKQLDEYKRSNIDLKGKQSRLGTMLVKTENGENLNTAQTDQDANVLSYKIEGKEQMIENLKSEISQLETENEKLQSTPIPVVKPPPTAERNARTNYKTKQQDIQQLTADYDQMRRNYSIKIQQASQAIETSKHEVEKLEMQLNSILSRISLMTRGNTKRLPEPNQTLNQEEKLRPVPKSNLPPIHPNLNNQGLPQLTTIPVELPEIPLSPKLSNENQIKHPRQIVSEPRNDLKERAFHRSTYKVQNDDPQNNVKNDDPLIPVPIPPRSVSGRISARRLPTPEMNKTDELLTNAQAVFEEADNFIKEINNEEKKTTPKEPDQPKQSPKKPKKKENEISFLPISEEEMKKVARPLTYNESQTPGTRIQSAKKAGYEFAFFFIAERIPKV